MHLFFCLTDSRNKGIYLILRLLHYMVRQLSCRLDAYARQTAELFRQAIEWRIH